MERLREI